MTKHSYDYVESGLLLAIKTPDELEKVSNIMGGFKLLKNVYDSIVNYYDQFQSFPSASTLKDKFNSLNMAAENAGPFDYFYDAFRRQVTFRSAVEAINKHTEALKQNPEDTIPSIISALEEIVLTSDTSISLYDDGTVQRAEELKERIKQRQTGLGILGIPTPFITLNSRGIGWLPGELTSLYARPGVGKSWMCSRIATTSMHHGFKTLLVTTEMPAKQLELRIDVILGQEMGFEFSHRALRRGTATSEMVKAYEKFLSQLQAKRLLVTDHVGEEALSLSGISGLVRTHRPDIIVVDGVYLLTSDESAVWEKNTNLFQGLKNLAILKNIAVIASTQADKNAKDLFIPPTAGDVAFGDGLLKSSDVAFSMCKSKESDTIRIVQFQKIRDDEEINELTFLNWNVDSGNIKEVIKGDEAHSVKATVY